MLLSKLHVPLRLHLAEKSQGLGFEGLGCKGLVFKGSGFRGLGFTHLGLIPPIRVAP